MPDANELVETLKKAAVDAMEAKKPVNVYFGEVISSSPLKINVEQKMILSEKQLILSRNVTDFKTELSGGDIQKLLNSSKSAYSAEITIHNGLVVGDEVIIVRQQEGQKFIVLDRIGT